MSVQAKNVVVWIVLTFLTTHAFAQSPASDLKGEVDTLKSENAAVREMLRKMEERQEALLLQIGRLEQRLDGVASDGKRPATGSAIPVVDVASAPAREAFFEPPKKED